MIGRKKNGCIFWKCTIMWGSEEPKVGKFLAEVPKLGKITKILGKILSLCKLKVRNWHGTYKIYEQH